MASAQTLRRTAALMERPIEWIGRSLGVLVVMLVLLLFAVVMLRYGWGQAWPWMREGVLALNAAVFLLGASYALQQGEHVRIDVFSRRFSPRLRAIVESACIVFLLLPFCVFVFMVSDHYVWASIAISERSPEPGGLPLVWPIKALIPAMALLLGWQGLALLLRALADVLAPPAAESVP